ncbi:cobalamin-binding protein [Micromonospora echinofusca]|uniref:Cobalamin-binding protein n=1 Tax=Micromonospora echinofusca TaxID=47858 RepID=A0ABS3W0B4_MICEH|nr:cobalamin-binding protein [Micromonospora echinofusca]
MPAVTATSAVTSDDLRRYVELLGHADADGAVDLVTELLARGVDPVTVLLDLVAPAQESVGERWASGRWSIGQEHAATSISDQVVAAVADRCRRTPTRGEIVVACVDGEWHALPARLFAEVIRLHGWSVRFLGASVPAAHLVTYLQRHDLRAVALSCSVADRLPRARRVIEAVAMTGVPLLAGGRGFGPEARWALRLGADAAAVGAREAVDILASWPAAWRPHGDPPPPVDDEHELVARRRSALVEAAGSALDTGFPGLRRSLTGPARSTLDESLGQLVDFLVAALLVDDVDLFTDFVAWTARILGTRDVPPASVDAVLGTYAAALYDFPRAQAQLAAGRRIL